MKKLIISMFCALAATIAGAQTLPSLMIGTDPSATGMAGASVATEATPYALDINPAAMSLSGRRLSAGVSYGMWEPKESTQTLIGGGAWYRIKSLAVGIGAKVMLSPGYEQVNGSGVTSQTAGVFKPKESSYALGVSYGFAKHFSVGLTARLGSSVLASDAKCTFFNADLGFMYSGKNVSAAVTAANLGGKVSYGGDKYAQPMAVRGGAAYTFIDCITVSAQADYVIGEGLMAAAGVRYCYKDIVNVNAGYHYGASSAPLPSFASAGIGVGYWGVKLHLTYLFASPTLSNSLLAGISYSF